MANKKHRILESLLEYCKKHNNLTFRDDLVKEFAKEYDFRNLFDVTKLDSL